MIPAVEIVPAGHCAQTLVLDKVFDCAAERAYVPALQQREPEQDALVKPVVDPHVPAGQSVQVDALANEYFPTGQIVHPEALTVPDPVTVPA